MSDRQSRIDEITRQINFLADERSRLAGLLLLEKSQFAIAERIQWKRGSTMMTGIVQQVIPWAGDSPSWKVRVIRKDGSDGSLMRVYEWNNPKRASEP